MIDVVIWSGGLDSTLLLNNLAKDSSQNQPVWAISFDGEFLDANKKLKEREARNNYLKYAKSKGYHIIDNLITIKSTYGVNAQGWAQAVCWISFMLPFIPNDCRINFGYIQGDSIWSGTSALKEIINQIKYLRGCQHLELNFPFEFTSKWEILQQVQLEKIPGNCYWTCETPRKIGKLIKACGKCLPCINKTMANFELKLRTT